MDGATGSEVHGRGGRAAQWGGVAELDPPHELTFTSRCLPSLKRSLRLSLHGTRLNRFRG
jgi:hypothetical protein